MNGIDRLALLYFKPKAIEIYRNRPVYEFIGIRLFKKYLPTSGDLVRRWKTHTLLNWKGTRTVEELYRYEKKTRQYEWRHLLGALAFLLLTLLLDRKLTWLDWILLPLLNLYINIYPIFLQRYNRIRVINVLKAFQKPNPYDSLPPP